MKRWLKHQRARYRMFREFVRDWKRYEKYAAPAASELSSTSDQRHLECQLTKDYHRVEKGLALGNPKRPFGAEVQSRLERIGAMADRAGVSDPYRVFAQDALGALAEWNDSGVISSTLAPRELVTGSLTPQEISDFMRSRHSIRDFDITRSVDETVLLQATELAQTAPSVCNRQPWAVHYFVGIESSRKVLAFQNGNRGFGDAVPAVGVVSVDTRLFGQPGERNQGWIEGGIFAMNLVTALQGLGLGSCMLNLSLTTARADAVREAVGLKPYELPIMMVAIGHPSANARSARSPRREVADVGIVVAPGD